MTTRIIPETVGGQALNDVFDGLKINVIAKLSKTNLKAISSTFDTWTDNYKHNAYICFTIHFIDDLWDLRSCTLGTVMLPRPHTADNIKTYCQFMLRDFGLDNIELSVTCVTDGGSNVVKACQLMKFDREACIAHGLHNLLSKSLLKCPAAVTDFTDIFAIIPKIIAALRYKYEETKREFESNNNSKYFDLMQSFDNIGKIN